MNKNEILEKSRQENKGRDEFEKYTIDAASSKAVAVGGILCCVIIFIEAFIFNKVSFNMWAVYLAIAGTTLLVKFHYRRKKHELIFGIMELILAAVFVTIHFLSLGGIALGLWTIN